MGELQFKAVSMQQTLLTSSGSSGRQLQNYQDIGSRRKNKGSQSLLKTRPKWPAYLRWRLPPCHLRRPPGRQPQNLNLPVQKGRWVLKTSVLESLVDNQVDQ